MGVFRSGCCQGQTTASTFERFRLSQPNRNRETWRRLRRTDSDHPIHTERNQHVLFRLEQGESTKESARERRWKTRRGREKPEHATSTFYQQLFSRDSNVERLATTKTHSRLGCAVGSITHTHAYRLKPHSNTIKLSRFYSTSQSLVVVVVVVVCT